MTRISDYWFRLAVLSILAGMGMGLYMGATETFTLASAHAHNNLLGWVSMMLFGIFYRLFPAAGPTRLATAHFWLYLVSVVVLIPALILQLLGNLKAAPFVIVSSTTTALSMVIFAVILFKATARRADRDLL